MATINFKVIVISVIIVLTAGACTIESTDQVSLKTPVVPPGQLVAADEAVLALTGYKLPDPIRIFYAARGSGISDHYLRKQVLLSDPSAMQPVAPQGGASQAIQTANGPAFRMATSMGMPASFSLRTTVAS